MSTTLISLDDLFAKACGSVEANQLVVLRGLAFQGTINGAVEYGVKLHSDHPEITGDPRSNGEFDPQPWIDDWREKTGNQLVDYPGAWVDVVFRMFGGEFADIVRQLTRAVVADYLVRRITAERPDLVILDQERRALRAAQA